jgi:hypothetical protein
MYPDCRAAPRAGRGAARGHVDQLCLNSHVLPSTSSRGVQLLGATTYLTAVYFISYVVYLYVRYSARRSRSTELSSIHYRFNSNTAFYFYTVHRAIASVKTEKPYRELRRYFLYHNFLNVERESEKVTQKAPRILRDHRSGSNGDDADVQLFSPHDLAPQHEDTIARDCPWIAL